MVMAQSIECEVWKTYTFRTRDRPEWTCHAMRRNAITNMVQVQCMATQLRVVTVSVQARTAQSKRTAGDERQKPSVSGLAD